MTNIDKEFTVSFWIKIEKNPTRTDIDSNIFFNPIFSNNGVNIFFSKIKNKFKTYILHPDLGHKKLICDISKNINNNTFVALTNTNDQSTLYIDAEIKDKKDRKTKVSELEENDYVMIKVKKGELKNLNFSDEITEAVVVGKVISFWTDTVKIDLFQIGEIGEFKKERLVGIDLV